MTPSGFNFCPRVRSEALSSRSARRSAIARALPAGVLKRRRVRRRARREIERAIAAACLDAVQLHGHETPEPCRGFAVPVIKAIAHALGSEPRGSARRALRRSISSCSMPMWRAKTAAADARFDWRQAAGVAPGGVCFWRAGCARKTSPTAIRGRCAPYAVDVASGVESAPGRKDAALVREFIHNAKHA